MEDDKQEEIQFATQVVPTPALDLAKPLQSKQYLWLIFLIILLLIGVASYFGYKNYKIKQQFARPTPTTSQSVLDNNMNNMVSPAPNLEDGQLTSKYQNDKFGFEIKYPKE